jgi:hypothetical protein
MRHTLIVALVLFSACSPNQSAEPSGDLESSGKLANEFHFEAYPGSQWYGPNGDEIPQESEIINAITAPEHCGWETAVMMHVGWPLGRAASDSSESRQYLRDPDEILPGSLMTTFDPDTQIPTRARNTGYRTAFMEPWLHPDDDTAAYLVFEDHIERWPRARDAIACG